MPCPRGVETQLEEPEVVIANWHLAEQRDLGFASACAVDSGEATAEGISLGRSWCPRPRSPLYCTSMIVWYSSIFPSASGLLHGHGLPATREDQSAEEHRAARDTRHLCDLRVHASKNLDQTLHADVLPNAQIDKEH